MKEQLLLVVKGFFIGIANIIPGVSGGTLAITLGIYEQLIDAISHFFKNFKKNMKFLIPVGIGAILSILLMSRVISYSMTNFPFPTTLFFLGLILGGIPLLGRKIKQSEKKMSHMSIFACTFSLVILFALLQTGNHTATLVSHSWFDYLILFGVGAIAAATMVIPGISGSFVLMLLGFYQPILDTINHLTSLQNVGSDLMILIPFGLGVLIGIILVAKLLEFLLQKFEIPTYYGIIGFVLASLLLIVKPLLGGSFDLIQILCGVVTLVVGGLIAYKLGDA